MSRPQHARPTMTVTRLAAARAGELRRAPFTYAEVGVTSGGASGDLREVQRTWALAASDFHRAGERLMTWRMHARAGLRVAASSPRAAVGEVVLMRLGIGPLGLHLPCRVVDVVDEPDRIGFAYGTLPGHPVSGEERFTVWRDERDRVSLSVDAFSRPATLPMRLGGAAARWAQDRFAERYPRALMRP